MPNDFTKTMANQTDKELVRIVQEAKNYHPDAVEAAKAELASREVPDDLILKLQQDVAKGNEPFIKLNFDFGKPIPIPSDSDPNILDMPDTTTIGSHVSTLVKGVGYFFIGYTIYLAISFVATIFDVATDIHSGSDTMPWVYFIPSLIILAFMLLVGMYILKSRSIGLTLGKIVSVLQLLLLANTFYNHYFTRSVFSFMYRFSVWEYTRLTIWIIVTIVLFSSQFDKYFNNADSDRSLKIDLKWFLPKFEKREE